MDADYYQKQTATTAIYPDDQALMYLVLGLTNEAGEVAGKLKKIIRDKGGVLGADDKKAMADEVSDCLWYAAQLCDRLGYTLSDVMQMNLDKLASRKERGVIGGSGDNR